MEIIILASIMLVCFFKIKSKIKIFIAWIILYFLPIFALVYDGEERF
ncbi:hypothetical protein [Helicobacter didelphidarum]|nr:hypothetical protein [Helicobacter didelphidarum]